VIDKSIFLDRNEEEIIEFLHKKRNSFRDCFKILDKKLNLKIVNWSIREETNEEYKIRKELEMEKLKELDKDPKGKKKPNNPKKIANVLKLENEMINSENDNKMKIKEIKPSNLYLSNDPKYNNYLKWFLSILQLIKDLNICDIETGKSIILNIYPQKNNFPVISPNGKYWIKVYFMGKARKMEIDDLIPCNKNEEFFFPRCDKFEEIWPALLTKAILKLHTYKRMSKYSEEVVDLAIIYSLTGYIVEKLPINSARIPKLEKYLQSNSNYLNKHKLIACMAWKEENKANIKHRNTLKGKNENEKNPVISKNSSTTVDFNLNLIPKERNKNIFNQMSSSLKKKSSLKNINQKLENDKNKVTENLKITKGVSDINNNSPGTNNFTNFLKNIPEENNFLLIKEKIFDDNKISEISEFDSIKENNSNNNDLIFSDNLNSKNKDLNDNNENLLEKNSPMKNTKYNEFIKRLKFVNSENNREKKSSKALFTLKIGENNLTFQEKRENENNPTQNIFNSIFRKVSSNLKTSKTILKMNFNLDSVDKQNPNRDDILNNYLYPILDFFDNKKFNMQRLTPLDFSDIIKLGQEGRTPGIYKQLSKEDKKKYLENLLEVKTKQRDIKNKRIEDIKKEGRRYNFIKLKNNTIGIPKLDFFIPYTDKEIFMTKKCLENKWDFPPPSYYENYENNNRDLSENTEDLTSHNEIQSEFFTNKISNKYLENLDEGVQIDQGKGSLDHKKNALSRKSKNDHKKETNVNITNIDNNDLYSQRKEDLDKNTDFNETRKLLKEDNNDNTKLTQISKKKGDKWSREIYLNIINHNFEQFETYVEPLMKYSGGNWINYSEFKKYFNFFILLHHPKSFKYQTNCDNLWINTNDSFEYNKKTSVLFLNNLYVKPTNLLNEESKDSIEKDDNQNFNFEQERFEHKKSTLLILFEPNNCFTKINEAGELFFYANFDLIDSFGKEIQRNIILSNFYSSYFNENLDREKNYFLLLKSFICPYGFNFTIFSDHACDCMDYGTYLKKFFSYENKTFKIDHPSFERNKTSLIAKFKIKLKEKTYFKINLNHPDKLSKKFIEIYLYFGMLSQNKKRINFDLNEKILFDPLDNDDYILSIVINPPYVLNSNTLEVDFYFDKNSTAINLLEISEPFKLYDRIKTNKYGIVFKEFIFVIDI